MKKLLLLFLTISCTVIRAQTVGLISYSPAAEDGFVLFTPNTSVNTYLIDKCGKLVHQWTSTHQPGQSVYLLEDGTLLRSGRSNNTVFTAGGNGGLIERFDWNGNLLWSYIISSATECQHHDIRALPNGNVLALVWELKTPAEATAAGRNPSILGASLWSEKIIEIQPTGTTSGTVVWEWHVWDHLIQEYDSTKANYGVVADHPELININYANSAGVDWLHGNALDYNDSLDQIIFSSHNLSEFWIIDHSTSSLEASSHNGGVYGKGGDLLYRWGNPAVYNRGTVADKKLFGQHNPHWITSGLPDAGNIMVFNNGLQRPAGNYSTVEIIAPPITVTGDYAIAAGQAFLPATSYWNYTAAVPSSFYATNISGAQRLQNGNTLICDGPHGNFFEVDTAGTTVWKYISPVGNMGAILSQGATPTQNSVFRCTQYPSTYAGFVGHSMAAGLPIELNPLPSACSLTGLNENGSFNSISITNPFQHQISFLSNEDIKAEKLLLTDNAGRTVAEWKNVEIRAGERKQLQLNEEVTVGFYYFTIITQSAKRSFKLIGE